MSKSIKLVLLFVALSFLNQNYAQEKFSLSGTLSDKNTNETLIGVTIIIEELKTGTTTNEYGFYSITLPKGEYTVRYTYIGFQDSIEKVSLTENIRKNISLKESDFQLDEIIVSENIEKPNIEKPEMSVNKISVNTIKKMPVILGETDILKSILTLPGVTNAGEGQSGFNVRGGAADQNLILLDEATIYNSSHLFGFFSVFNADAIKDLKLYKGGVPARFGGRVASVLDIYQKDGNSKKFHASGGIGLISSRILAEGPIVKDKGSFLVAGRSSYAHLFLKLTDNKNSAYFYDLNTKLSYKLNDNNNLYLSGYFGRDVFSLNQSFVNTYGNSVLNLRWNHLFDDKLFSNLSFIYSDYYYGLTLDFIGFNWDSGIKNYNLKYDFKHYLNDKTKLTYGVNAIYYDFNPGKIEPSDESSTINPDQLDKKYAFEPALYIDAEQKLSSKFSINYGLRYSLFYRLGAQEINVYANNEAVSYDNDLNIYEKATPIGTKKYRSNEVIANFSNLEPRLSMAYIINENQSVKASYNRMSQYLHLISNTQSPTPLDVWAPSDEFLKPQILDQYAIGYQKNTKNGKYSFEVESFYKYVRNRLDYIDGADLIANNAIEQVVLAGKSRAYGLEVLARKNEGKLNGWISYTLSRSEQKTAGRTPEEIGINNGNWYKTGWDKTHNLSVTAMYELNDKWSFGSIFSLQTGQPVTYPNGQYVYQGISVPSYGERNANNLPVYHRLDISATLSPRNNATKKIKGEWVFGIYNLYSRKNAASINFRQNADSGNNEAVRLSIFGIVPSITYNFKF
ncbi:TonB-dependent receptor [Flavobacterium jejuense]|uniref:isocitrate dehydrogenase (NADP(+)) n=1 Tax=Flavobacterium jejuense TaxID=1544455 RepID=A0ABX0ILZ7_9FLAO|nr:TonB-dependent receptor [Flavobacterium jejuense]NHN24743.1 TonB-dependent receptor [Flavobacterium jejuense]